MLASPEFLSPNPSCSQCGGDVDFSWPHIHNRDMTAVVAILCKDGVVIGSDGCALEVPADRRTVNDAITRTTVKNKISIIDECFVCAASGTPAYIQMFIRTMEKKASCLQCDDPQETGNSIARTFIDDLGPSHQTFPLGLFLALPSRTGIALLEFPYGVSHPELKHEENWYGSTGSWLGLNPIIRFTKRALFPHGLPLVNNGILIVMLALTLACELAPSGVSEPISIATLRRDDAWKVVPHLLTARELAKEKRRVEDAFSYFGKYLKK